MVFRVDPADRPRRRAVVPPRPLRRRSPTPATEARINSAYRRDDPQRLIDTIYENFGVGIDHFIQVDFCTFKTLVDAVGGVTVPFDFPARDTEHRAQRADGRLLHVRRRPRPGLRPLAATTSTRTRRAAATGEDDQTSDLGRISRQQDFLRRTLPSVLAKGLLNPSVARGLIDAATGGDVVTDNELSLAKLLEFAGVLRDVEPDAIPTYQIESPPRDDRRQRPCSSRASRATTCRPCWRCSAARRSLRRSCPTHAGGAPRPTTTGDDAATAHDTAHAGTADAGAGDTVDDAPPTSSSASSADHTIRC